MCRKAFAILGLILTCVLSAKSADYRLTKSESVMMLKLGEGAKSDTLFVVNCGDKELVINSVSGRCGCVETEWDKRPKRSGDSAMVVVRFKPEFVGFFSKNITIKTNCNPKKTTFRVSGEVSR